MGIFRVAGGTGRSARGSPPPPVDSSQGCLACWTYRVWFWFFFQKNSPWGSGASRRPPVKRSIRKKILQDGPRWLPRWPRWPKMASKMVQDGLQVRPRWSKTASKTAQESPRRPKIASRWPKTAQEAPKRPPRQPKRPPRAPPGGPEEAKIIDFL